MIVKPKNMAEIAIMREAGKMLGEVKQGEHPLTYESCPIDNNYCL